MSDDLPMPSDGKMVDRNLVVSLPEDHGPFTDKAFSELNSTIVSYIWDLIDESSRVSRRNRADTISANDVEQAAMHIASARRRSIYRHMGTLGGILLGAAISTILPMISDGNLTALGVGVSLILAVVGSSLMALHFAKE